MAENSGPTITFTKKIEIEGHGRGFFGRFIAHPIFGISSC
jgi:hypothetical protein